MLHLIETPPPASRTQAERRHSRRYPIERFLSYRYACGRAWSEASDGQTLNISSTGILFSGKKPISAGKRLEISISWPVELDGRCGLKLVALGRVVRSAGDLVAAKIDKYEFRLRSENSVLTRAGLPQVKRLKAAG